MFGRKIIFVSYLQKKLCIEMIYIYIYAINVLYKIQDIFYLSITDIETCCLLTEYFMI